MPQDFADTKAAAELAALRPARDTVATIGVFDGVHLGHQYLMRELKRAATRAAAQNLVVTFVNHPRTVLRPDLPTTYLTSLERRLALLRAQTVDLVAPITFDAALSRLRAAEFLTLLKDRARVRGLVVGPDFAMGRGREGTVPVLQALGKKMDIAVAVVAPWTLQETAVSSTAVRQALAGGDTEAVARMLGRAFCLDGTVGHGDRRGNTMGFPTTNLQLPADMALPKDGIYATWTVLEDKRYLSATSIGVRPTIGEGLARTIETFILDFSGDIYEQPMSLEFAKRLRDELKFDSMPALAQQMERDVANARAALREAEWMLAASEVR